MTTSDEDLELFYAGRSASGSIGVLIGLYVLWKRWRVRPMRETQLTLLLLGKLLTAMLMGFTLAIQGPCLVEAAVVWFSQTLDNCLSAILIAYMVRFVSCTGNSIKDDSIRRTICETAPSIKEQSDMKPEDELVVNGLRVYGKSSHVFAQQIFRLPGVSTFFVVRPIWVIIPFLLALTGATVMSAIGEFGPWVPWCLFSTFEARVLMVHTQIWFLLFLCIFCLIRLIITSRQLAGSPHGQTIKRFSRSIVRLVFIQTITLLPGAYVCTWLLGDFFGSPTQAVTVGSKIYSALVVPITNSYLPASFYLKIHPELKTKTIQPSP